MIEHKAAGMIYQDIYNQREKTEKDTSRKKKTIKLFHYTNTDVLYALLSKCTFRASSFFYLNDSMEYYEGINLLKNILSVVGMQNDFEKLMLENGRGDSNEGIFTISFSQKEDLLSQWITYAKESGVAIELDYNLIEKEDWYGVEKSSNTDKKESDDLQNLLFFGLKYNLFKIDYDHSWLKNGSELFLRYSSRYNSSISNFNEKVMYIASFFKENAFRAEDEVRLSVLPVYLEKGDTEEESGKVTRVDAQINYYRMGDRGILRPYLDITFGLSEEKNDTYIFKPCLPLKTITIGPGGTQQEVFDSVVHYMRYGKPKVYDYTKNNYLLKKNILNYIYEILEWLIRKEYISSFVSVSEKGKVENSIDKLIDIRTNSKTNSKDKDRASHLISTIVRDLEEMLHKEINYYTKPLVKNVKLNAEETSILREIKDNFYFSKEGILIKKSIISYIF